MIRYVIKLQRSFVRNHVIGGVLDDLGTGTVQHNIPEIVYRYTGSSEDSPGQMQSRFVLALSGATPLPGRFVGRAANGNLTAGGIL